MQYQVANLRCEYLKNPLAIDKQNPRLSWEGLCPREGARQTAYRIIAADSVENLKKDKGNLWDSGKVESNQSLHIRYKGKSLKSFQQVFWKVMAWDERGKAGKWSKPNSWTMGILDIKEWRGTWIGNHLRNAAACPLLRKEFGVKGKVSRVLIHASALGLYHLTLNGKDVSDELLAPGWYDFAKRRYYRCYDITKMVNNSGKNCIGAELADGWYKGPLKWDRKCENYGRHAALLAQIRIEYESGKVETIASDESWNSIFGSTLQTSFLGGESVDAQLTLKGWDKPGFKEKGWSPAETAEKIDPAIPLQCYPAEPVRKTQEIKPVKMWQVNPGKYIFDFGQNFAGFVRLNLKGKAGAVIRMRFGEMVNLDNTLYVDNLRSAFSTDVYVMKGLKKEVWEPKFTFHGFRYMEVSGCPYKPDLNSFTGVVIGSDTTRVGHFECSDPMVNQIYSNAVWTQRANFIEVPTDCPQRDERLGWTGDAQVFIRTAISNMDVAAFFTKWMTDLADSQHKDGAFPNVSPEVMIMAGDAAWGDAGVVCPWTLYQCYEDRELLEKMYPRMKKWVQYLKDTSKGLLRGPEIAHCFGDWLSINADTPKEVIQTAHFAYATDITRKAAEALGKKADIRKYEKLFTDIRKAFNKAYVKNNGRIHGNTQTAYLMAIKFGLLDEKNEKLAIKYLVEDIRKKNCHLSTGFVGTALIMPILRDTGNVELAYKLLENKTFPSWGYSIVNGATSIWERWNGWTKDKGPGDVNMNSYSHYAYGAVVEWMFSTITGIDHGGTGFQNFVLRPQPGGSLKHAAATFDSPYGTIATSWQKAKGSRIVFNAKIPANTQATVILPVDSLDKVKLNGKKLCYTVCDCNIKGKEFVLPGGEYTIEF